MRLVHRVDRSLQGGDTIYQKENCIERKENGQKIGLRCLHFESEESKGPLRSAKKSWRKTRTDWVMESNSCFVKISCVFILLYLSEFSGVEATTFSGC